jgi:Ni/Co efflux regulator RcnB
MQRKFVYAAALAAALAASPAFADKPDWAGKGKGKGHEQGEDRDPDENRGGRHAKHFDEHHRVAVRDYYEGEYRGGKCPPGLAKKHNGCMPPGQAKKWQMGRPLPPDVVVYDVPPQLVVKIGIPPAGYKYVRAGADILMIAAGTRVVADAIQDLGRM